MSIRLAERCNVRAVLAVRLKMLEGSAPCVAPEGMTSFLLSGGLPHAARSLSSCNLPPL